MNIFKLDKMSNNPNSKISPSDDMTVKQALLKDKKKLQTHYKKLYPTYPTLNNRQKKIYYEYEKIYDVALKDEKYLKFLSKKNLLFGKLLAEKIIAIDNFTCCDTCGHDEIKHWQHIIPFEKDNRNIPYVFNNIQQNFTSMKRSPDRYEIYLSHGIINDTNNSLAQMKTHIVLAFIVEYECEQLGLNFYWDRNNTTNFFISMD